ncbi:signal peptide peptidase SppA [Roseimicrobium gellanilyticum]|uniref:Signal peptide peptidase SppA n=1 Tax=Roseimicrobium gellanilyticum TaxID=748857 RepID=A0A366HIE3_9BACT|nr:S49 family peptidase [Roseimicrobium gellanilyticum]RBP42432.1 signal peptide peptidase SppA [Roseimicrobium gellanilyticum]
MRTLPHFFTKLFAEPLMLHAPARAGFEAYLLGQMSTDASRPPVRMEGEEKAWRMKRVLEKRGRLAIVRIYGAIDKQLSTLEMECFGGCDLADVDRALAAAEADKSVDTVMLEFNSPGGSVTGVAETAARVANLRKTKEVHAFTETMCCSAATYIASQADHVVVTPSSTNGSIGVYMATLDESRALELAGITVNLMKAGKFKAMGASFKPLEDEERKMMQASVDRIHADFKAAVTSLRRVKPESMEGQWFDGREALACGLVDEITNMSADEYALAIAS